MKNYDFECVILTTAAMGTPHLETLQAANPGLMIHVHTAPDPVDARARLVAWRNCDRNVRNWWRANRETVANGRVLFLEWDVFVNVDLWAIVPHLDGLFCARLKMPVKDRSWMGFRELNLIPREIRGYAVGCEPSAVLMASRDVLDLIADEEWDDVFDADILSELRLGTVVRFTGYPVAGWKAWEATANMTPVRVPDGFQGILHPVKREVIP